LFFTRFSVLDRGIIRLNQIRITKHQPIFRLNYAMVIGIIIVTGITMLLIGWQEFRTTQAGFQIFAFFSFIAMPIGLGFLMVYIHILKVGEYRIGNGILLLFTGGMMAMAGVHLHDVIWCGVATDWYQTCRIGGYDLALFYDLFGITDTSRWDYRTFGLYMGIRVVIELNTGILGWWKYIQLNCSEGPIFHKSSRFIVPILMFLATLGFGIVAFIFDYPWMFSMEQYYTNLFIGIPLVGFLFVLAGRSIDRIESAKK